MTKRRNPGRAPLTDWKHTGNRSTRNVPPYTLYVYQRVDGWHCERHRDGRSWFKGPFRYRTEACAQAMNDQDWWDVDYD
jgi:hypothetical protein